MKVCGTGHRPEDCEDEKIVRIKARAKLSSTPAITTFITGMAAGYDLWAGDEALSLGKKIICAIPWRGHEPRRGDEQLYNRLLSGASKVHYCSEADDYPGPKIYQDRNVWMVDNSDAIMAYWSGKEKGGTYNCIKYAEKQRELRGYKITNIYDNAPY